MVPHDIFCLTRLFLKYRLKRFLGKGPKTQINARKREQTQANSQKTADVWKKDVWDFQGSSQTFSELEFSQEMKEKRAGT